MRTAPALVLFCIHLISTSSSATSVTVEGGSIAQGINSISPGDTVLVKDGVYGATYFNKSGEEGKFITIKNFPGHMPEINGWDGDEVDGGQAFGGPADASWIRIEGFYVTGFRFGLCSFNWINGITEEEKKTAISGSNIELRYNVVDLCGMNGMSVFFTENVTYEYNLVSRTGWESPDHSWSSGINLLGNGGKLIVRNNISFHHVDISEHHTDGNGFIIDQSFGKINSAIVENNIAFLNGGSGFGTTSSENVSYIGNTTYNNWQDDEFGSHGAGGISFSNTESRNTGVVKNNLCIQTNRGEPIIVYGSNLSSLNGVSNNFTSKETSDASVIFEDPDNGDFRIKEGATDVIGKADGSDIFTHGIGFDPKAIKAETDHRQPFYRFAPDIEYIKSKGGLEGCFAPVERKAPPAIGAYASVVMDTSTSTLQHLTSNRRIFFSYNNHTSILNIAGLNESEYHVTITNTMGRAIVNTHIPTAPTGEHLMQLGDIKMPSGIYPIIISSPSGMVRTLFNMR